jgi:hypothetical protein
LLTGVEEVGFCGFFRDNGECHNDFLRVILSDGGRV